jgi:hypothetical protein
MDKNYQSFGMLKMTVFWDIAPRSLVKFDRRFRGAYRLHYQGDEKQINLT